MVSKAKKSPSTNNSNGVVNIGSGIGPIFPANGLVQDVMLVGEPTLMGGELGEEDERLISRLENSQYKAPPVDGDDLSVDCKPSVGSINQLQPSGPGQANRR